MRAFLEKNMARTVSIGNFKYTVQQAFRECFYEIPDYQRAYVWEEGEVQQLLEDIDEQFRADVAREGLEFEAVFFVGVDKLAESHPDLFEKYLYVGATRAATYFGMTCEKEFPAKIDSIQGLFQGNWS